MTHRNARLTPVTRADWSNRCCRLAPGRKWPACSASPARPSPSGCGGSAKVGQTRSSTAPAVPCAAPARPVSCRKRPSALHAACLPGGRTASGGGWASPAPPSTPSCAAPDSIASRGSIAPPGRSFATSMPGPGALVHLDIKKLGRIPQGGGKRILPGFAETHSGPQRGPRLGFDFLHVAVDDHSRYAYVEALPDERGPTAAAFLVRALAHFERQSIAVERILTDNGACYVSRIFTDTAAARNIRVKRTRPFRPQTNGKAEAFNKIAGQVGTYDRTTPTASGSMAASVPCLLQSPASTRRHWRGYSRLACQQPLWELQLGRWRPFQKQAYSASSRSCGDTYALTLTIEPTSRKVSASYSPGVDVHSQSAFAGGGAAIDALGSLHRDRPVTPM